MSSITPQPSPPPPASLLDYTLRTAPLDVIKGTAFFTALGAVAGSATGIIRNIPAMPAAFQTSVNMGVFSFTFFSIREYLLHPLFTVLELRPSPLDPTAAIPTGFSAHTYNVPSSIVAGMLSGTVFHAFMRGGGLPASARAGLTLGIGCGVVQTAGNELGVLRRGILQWREEKDLEQRREQSQGSSTAVPGSNESSGSVLDGSAPLTHKEFGMPSRETFSERSDRLFGEGWGWFKGKMASLSPVKKIDQREYVDKLETRLKEVESEKVAVAQEMKELEQKRQGSGYSAL